MKVFTVKNLYLVLLFILILLVFYGFLDESYSKGFSDGREFQRCEELRGNVYGCSYDNKLSFDCNSLRGVFNRTCENYEQKYN